MICSVMDCYSGLTSGKCDAVRDWSQEAQACQQMNNMNIHRFTACKFPHVWVH